MHTGGVKLPGQHATASKTLVKWQIIMLLAIGLPQPHARYENNGKSLYFRFEDDDKICNKLSSRLPKLKWVGWTHRALRIAYQRPVDYPNKGPVTVKFFDDVIMCMWVYWKVCDFSTLLDFWAESRMAWSMNNMHLCIRDVSLFSKTMTHDDVIKWKHFPRNWALWGNSPVTGEFPSQRPVTQELWCFLWSEPTVEQIMETLVIWDATALIMTSL